MQHHVPQWLKFEDELQTSAILIYFISLRTICSSHIEYFISMDAHGQFSPVPRGK